MAPKKKEEAKAAAKVEAEKKGDASEAKAEEPEKDQPKTEEKQDEPTIAEKSGGSAAEGAMDEKPKDEAKEDEENPKVEDEEEENEPEAPAEIEEDAVADSRAKVSAEKVAWSGSDSTLNVVPIAGGTVFSSLGEGGTQYLLASVRSTVGLKAGRYMFEARIVEQRRFDQGSKRGDTKPPHPLICFRVGLSLANSSLFLGDTEDSVCFDIEGLFMHGAGKQTKLSSQLKTGTLAVLVNLDSSSPNANTISLFKNGFRVSAPQPIPENLKGKPLFPTITYRNVMFEANFGPSPWNALPFQCRMVREAAEADVDTVSQAAPADGRYEVLFPVCLPGHGFFDWVDDFVEKNPGYTELSDRKIVDWAAKSGMYKPKNQNSNDKPSAQFGIPLMDDLSVRRVLHAFAATQKRNFLVAEQKANLVKQDRQAHLAQWAGRGFKAKAAVMMGEPTKDHKDKVKNLILKDKTAKAEVERKKKVAELRRKKAAELRKKKIEEAKRAKEKKVDDSDGKQTDEAAEDVDVQAEAEAEVEPIKVELTEEEQNLCARKCPLPDISEKALAKAFSNFCLPEQDEGFEEIQYVWQPVATCEQVLSKFILDLKLSQRCEELKPGAWFKEQHAAFNKSLQEWKKKQNEWKDPEKRKALVEKIVADKKESGDEAFVVPEIDVDSLDVFSVEDVANVGSGEPLFSKFAYEDWTLLSIRSEIHLMLHAFKKDMNDPDRTNIPQAHFIFYYQKYWKKQFDLASFGAKKLTDFLDLIKDTVTLFDKGDYLGSQLVEDTPFAQLVKLTEDHRRERERRVDAGDETARLNFVRAKPNTTQSDKSRSDKLATAPRSTAGKSGGKSTGKGGGKSGGKSVGKAGKSRFDSPASGKPWASRDSDSRRPPPSAGARRYSSPPRGVVKRPWPAPTSASQPAWKRPRDSDYRGSTYRSGSGGGKGGGYRR